MAPPAILVTGSDRAGKSALLQTIRHCLQNSSFLSELTSSAPKSPPESPQASSSSSKPEELPELVECRDDQAEAWIRMRGRKRAIICIYLIQPNDFPLLHPPSRPSDVISRIYATIRRYTQPTTPISKDAQPGSHTSPVAPLASHITLIPVLSKSDAYTMCARHRVLKECRNTLAQGMLNSHAEDLWSVICPDWAELDQLSYAEDDHLNGEQKQSRPKSNINETVQSTPPPEAMSTRAAVEKKDDPLSRLASLCASLSPPSSPQRAVASPTSPAPIPPAAVPTAPSRTQFVREYPWGKCNPFNPQYSDLVKLLEWTFKKTDELLTWTPPKEESAVDADGSVSPTRINGRVKNSAIMDDDDVVSTCVCLEDCDGTHDPESHRQRQEYLKEKLVKSSSNGDVRVRPLINPDDLPNGSAVPHFVSPSGRRWSGAATSTTERSDDSYSNGHPRPTAFSQDSEMTDGEWRRETQRRKVAEMEEQQPQSEEKVARVPTSNSTQASPHRAASESSSAENGRVLLPPSDSMIASDQSPLQLLTPPTPHDHDFRSNNPPCVPSSGNGVSLEAYTSPANHSDSTHSSRHHRPRKPKTLLACNFCRSRKLKCYPVPGPSESYSCNECTKRNIACEVSADREARRTEREHGASNYHHQHHHDREDKPRPRTNDGDMAGAAPLDHHHQSRENVGRPLVQARIEEKSSKETELRIVETPVERKDKEPHSVVQTTIRLSHPYDQEAPIPSRPASQHPSQVPYHHHQHRQTHSHHSISSVNSLREERSMERREAERGTRVHHRPERDRRASDPLERERGRDMDLGERYRDASRETNSTGKSRPLHHLESDRSRSSYPPSISQHPDSLSLTHLPHHVPSQSQPVQPHHPNQSHQSQHYPRHGSHSQSHAHAQVHAPQAHLPSHLPPPPGAFHTLLPSGHSHSVSHGERVQHTTIHFSPTSPTLSNSSRISLAMERSTKRRSIDSGNVVVKPFAKAPSSRSGPKVVACNYCRARKTRCDGSTPCLNCKKRNLNCEYQIPSREAARRKKAQQAAAEAPADSNDTQDLSPNRSRPSTSTGSPREQGDPQLSQPYHVKALPPVHDRPPTSRSSPSFSPRLPSIAHLVSPVSPIDGHTTLKPVTLKRALSPDEETQLPRAQPTEEMPRQSKRMRLDALVNTPSP